MGEKETSALLPPTREVPLPGDQTAGAGVSASSAERASNLNLSKSNIDRLAQPESGGAVSELAANLNSSKSNIYRGVAADDGSGDSPDQAGNRMKAGLDRAGGMLSGGASLTPGEDDAGEAGRLSTNLSIERQTPKRDFGD